MNARFARLLAAVLCCVLAVTAQHRDQREASVGMRAYVEQIVLEGSELVPAPTSLRAPVMVRVVKTWPHGEHLRYDLEWVGFEPGSYDLTDYLVRRDGSAVEVLPPIEVRVTSVLPGDAAEPSELDPTTPERTDGYSRWKQVAIVAWIVGLLAILLVGRKWKTRREPPKPKPTLADRMRPLVEEVASGRAGEAQKAELERLLVAFWRARLDLGECKVADAVMAIRRHDEAGALLRQVEAWLHAPEPPASFDVAELLAPYRSVTADQFQPRSQAAPEEPR